MKTARQLMLLAFSFVLLFTCTSVAFAAAPNTTSEYITIEDCTNAGEKWIAANYPEGTTIENIVPIKNLANQLDGYCINFTTNNEPAGYLVLNAAKYSKSYIREFALDGNGIYEQLVTESRATSNIENVIYSTAPFEYAVKYTNGNEELFYNSNALVLTVEEQQATFGGTYFINETGPAVVSKEGSSDREEYYDAFFNGSSLTNFITANDKYVEGSTEFTPYTMSQLRTGTNVNNCGPTAATNICGFYNSLGNTKILKNGSISDTYDALVTAVGFDENGENGTKYDNLKSGLSSYVRKQSCNITINGYLMNNWSDFTRDFDANKLNIIHIRDDKYAENSWKVVGHFVVGIGYRILRDASCYIRVYDGWNGSSNRFLNFNADPIVSLAGASVTVS